MSAIIPLRIGESLEQAAVNYGRLGFRVFPLKPGGKEPQVRGWNNVASKHEGTIRRLWGKWPNANIGIMTGQASGFFVVDVDDRNGGFDTLDQLIEKHGSLPITAKQITGNGEHHLFKCNGPVKTRNNALGNGIDIKGDGGYIVAAPSLHPSGKHYQWAVQPHNLSVSPDWLLEEFTNGKEPAFVLPDTIPKGSRNDTLYRYGCSLRSKGWAQSQITAELVRVNEFHCESPLSDEQINKIINSAQKFGIKEKPLLFIWRDAIRTDESLSPTTRHILHVIGFHMDTIGKPSWPTMDLIAKESGYKRQTVSAHIKKAKKAGYLNVVKHQAEGQQYANNMYLIPKTFKTVV